MVSVMSDVNMPLMAMSFASSGSSRARRMSIEHTGCLKKESNGRETFPTKFLLKLLVGNLLVSMPDSEKYHWIVDVQSAFLMYTMKIRSITVAQISSKQIPWNIFPTGNKREHPSVACFLLIESSAQSPTYLLAHHFISFALHVRCKRKSSKHILPNGGEKWWFTMVQSVNDRLKQIQVFWRVWIGQVKFPTMHPPIGRHEVSLLNSRAPFWGGKIT